jgi:proline iminopeptidase
MRMMGRSVEVVCRGHRAASNAGGRATALVVAFALAACAEPQRMPPGTDGLQTINGTELYVKRMGAGEPIVVVHGGPVLEHGYFLPHLAPLADSYELIFYDQRLSGRSAPSVDGATVRIDTFVEDIEALREQLDLRSIHLMGHSWGGLLAMRYATLYAENLRSLTLVSSMAASAALRQDEELIQDERITPEDRRDRATIQASDEFANRQAEAIRQLLLLSYRSAFHDRARIAELELYVPDDYVARSAQFGRMRADLADFDYHDDIASVAVPVLILYGASEPAVYLGGAALRERVPHAEFVTISDAGHFPFVERPQAFLRAVTEFLEKTR